MPTDRPLDGNSAVITGASSGIGSETAHALAREGANVVLAARREERLQELAEHVENEYDTEAHVVPTDVTDEEQVAALVDETAETFGGLDVLVNNAGLGRGEGVEELSTADYRTMMDVNVDGCFFTTRAALPHLRESRGEPRLHRKLRGPVPAAVEPGLRRDEVVAPGFALSVSSRVGDDGVAVSVINPSEVRTEFGGEESFEERFEEGEVTEPDEIAAAVAFAARQDRSMVSELDLYRRDKLTGF